MGLSAGTGLGVSAALVSNNGSTQNVANQNDAAAAAPPPPPAPPPGAPPPEEEEDPAVGSGNGAESQALPVDTRQNDILVATGGRDDHGGSAELSSNSKIAKNKTGCEAVESTSLAESQCTSSSHGKTADCVRSKAETSSAGCVLAKSDISVTDNSNSRDVPTSSRSQSLSNGQRQQVSTCANRADIDRYASACRGGPLQHNSTAAARAHGSDADNALQIQLVDNRGEKHTRDAPQFHLIDPSDRACDSGKGKSLVGSRKGVVKRSAPSRVVHQSCQAVSEEIRQSTKRAKEEGEILDLNPCRVPLSNAVSSAGPSMPSSGTKRSQCETEDEGEGEAFSRRVRGKRPKMCDQATSTSDPVIEDDHIQVRQWIRVEMLPTQRRGNQQNVHHLWLVYEYKVYQLSGSKVGV